VSLERGPLSLVSTIEELLESKSSGSGLESREYGRRDLSRWPRDNLYPQESALTSPCNVLRVCDYRTWCVRYLAFAFHKTEEFLTKFTRRSCDMYVMT
jgi:hypothetical protein